MISMTGFGYSRMQWKGCEILIEVKCYNNRFLDLRINLPHFFSDMEGKLREMVLSRFIRGRVEISMLLKGVPEVRKKVVFHSDMALEWNRALKKMSALFSVPVENLISVVPKYDEIFTLVSEEDVYPEWSVLGDVFSRVIDEAARQREEEGMNLQKDVKHQITAIISSLKKLDKQLPEHTRGLKEAFRNKFRELLQDPLVVKSSAGLPDMEIKTLLEAATRTIKSDINEEIARLKSHLKAFEKQINAQGPHGKKLDFLAQEMGREITTMSMKIYSPELIQPVIIMKDCLEKLREQLRNIQ